MLKAQQHRAATGATALGEPCATLKNDSQVRVVRAVGLNLNKADVRNWNLQTTTHLFGLKKKSKLFDLGRLMGRKEPARKVQNKMGIGKLHKSRSLRCAIALGPEKVSDFIF